VWKKRSLGPDLFGVNGPARLYNWSHITRQLLSRPQLSCNSLHLFVTYPRYSGTTVHHISSTFRTVRDTVDQLVARLSVELFGVSSQIPLLRPSGLHRSVRPSLLLATFQRSSVVRNTPTEAVVSHRIPNGSTGRVQVSEIPAALAAG
jgi:hypothetical protein